MTADQQFEDLSSDSTLIRRGVRALTLSDMQEFADLLEHRPLDKLLGDFNDFARLSESKFILARNVIRRRMRDLPSVECAQLRTMAVESVVGDDAAAERIRRIFD